VTDPKKRTPSELLDAIHDMHLDDELERIAALSDDEVAGEIRELGGDPDAIGQRGADFVKAQMARIKARTEFDEKAAARISTALGAADKAPKTPALPRKELLAMIDRAMKQPRFAQPIAMAFKKRKREAASDEELRTLLDRIAQIEAIAQAEGLDSPTPKKKTKH